MQRGLAIPFTGRHIFFAHFLQLSNFVLNGFHLQEYELLGQKNNQVQIEMDNLSPYSSYNISIRYIYNLKSKKKENAWI